MPVIPAILEAEAGELPELETESVNTEKVLHPTLG